MKGKYICGNVKCWECQLEDVRVYDKKKNYRKITETNWEVGQQGEHGILNGGQRWERKIG